MPFAALEAIKVIEFFPAPLPVSSSISPSLLSPIAQFIIAVYIVPAISTILSKISTASLPRFVSGICVVDSVIRGKTIETSGLILRSPMAFNHQVPDHHVDSAVLSMIAI